jgi:(R)-2-hydroxyacyl-CoA dehydratese activating ATPase
MIAAGLDVGSRTIKLVTLAGPSEKPRDSIVVLSGANPVRRCREAMGGLEIDRLVVTGYGRHLVGGEFGASTVSEIKAYAVGARIRHPDARTVIDVGGQDSKVTLLTDSGDVQKFEMNDRCAAGTGRFLEVMAGNLEVDIAHLGGLALDAARAATINSLCTVFAESEVVSLIAHGEDSRSIALALHEAVVARIAAMARRVGTKDRVVFAGGAALNPCLVKLLAEKLGVDITVPDEPQTVGALGAALLAQREEGVSGGNEK